jgi:hypothetical protein
MPRTRSSRLLLLAAAALLAAGCSPNVDFPKGGQLLCQSNDDCPGESVCQVALGQCVPKDALGAAPPALAGPASVSPTYGNTATTFTISFDVTQKLLRAPELWAELRDQKLSLTLDEGASSGEHYVFHYQPAASDPEGVAGLFVKLVDEAGNVADGLTVGTLVVDDTPPGVIFPRVEYLAAETNPLGAAVGAARVGTRIRVQVTANEPLDPASDPKLTATNGVDTLTFAATQVTEDGAAFEVTVPAGASDSPAVYVPHLSGWKDAAGNVSSASSFSEPAIRVQTTEPALAVDQAQVEYLRSPWGNATAETLDGGFQIPAGPYFALAPLDPLGGPATLPAGTFTTGDGGVPTRVRIWADDQRETLLGTAAAADAGTWPRLRLVGVDSPRAFATALDEAGNESAPVALTHAEWVATPRAPAFGPSPQVLDGTSVAVASLDLDPGMTRRLDPAAASGVDGAAVLQQAELAWRQLTGGANSPGPHRGAAMAYDPKDGAVYLFGGETETAPRSNALWRWDGARWTELAASGPWPSERRDSALVYDSVRDSLVLFGGVGDNMALNDLWEWDGAGWSERTPTGPGPAGRSLHRMVYDSRRGRVVLYGGFLEGSTYDLSLWEWDGASWEEHPADASAPGSRPGHGMAYDTRRGRVVIFGGFNVSCPNSLCSDTWEWDGTAWSHPSPGVTPSGRAVPMMTYDEGSERVLLFGGEVGSDPLNANDVWEWDGASWVERTPLSGDQPEPRSWGGLVYDPVVGRSVLFGDDGPLYVDTWSWNGASWERHPASSPVPPSRELAGMTYDAQRDRVVLFGGVSPDGGVLDDLWEFDGDAWSDRTPPTRPDGGWPAPRAVGGMAYDSVRHRTVLYGDHTLAPAWDDLWEWDGTTWANRTFDSATKPGPSSDFAMVFDGTRSELFHSNTGENTVSVWRWNGSTWTNPWDGYSAGVGPVPRRAFAAAYDPIRGVTVFFGGAGDNDVSLGDLWEWNGSTWSQKTPTGPAPTARQGARAVFDANRGQVVLFGGLHKENVSEDPLPLQDLWAWNGTSWTDLTPAGRKPSGREGHGMVYDSARQRVLIYAGASEGAADSTDTWLLDEPSERQSALQFRVDGSLASLGPVTGVHVRARCGGTAFQPTSADGATLFGWFNGQGTNLPVGWAALDTNAVGTTASAPYLVDTDGLLLEWQSTSAAEASRYLLPHGRLECQCRALGGSGNAGEEARVAMDYIEARVQYLTP